MFKTKMEKQHTQTYTLLQVQKGVYSEKRPTLREKSLNNLSLYLRELEKDFNKQPHFIT